LLKHAKDAEGTFDVYVQAETWTETSIELAADADPLLVSAISAMSKAEQVKTILYLAAYTVAVNVALTAAVSGVKGIASLLGKINIPKNGFGDPNPPKKDKCSGSEEVTIDSVSSRLIV